MAPRPKGPGRDCYGASSCAVQYYYCTAPSRFRDRRLRRSAGRFRQAVDLALGAHLSDIMAKQDDVVFAPLTIADMVAKEGFRAKAEAFEQRDRSGLIDRHLHDDLFELRLQGQREHFLRQSPTDAKTAPLSRHDHANLADMGRPGQRIADQRAEANDMTVPDGDEAGHGAPLDLLDPGGKDFRFADVAGQKQQVVGRQSARESERRGFVRPCHAAEFNVAGLGLDIKRIGTFCLARHVERSLSHWSSFGHRRLLAFAPAATLMWPPLRMTSSLSVEETAGMSGLAAP